MEREQDLTLEAKLRSAQEMHRQGQLAAAYSAYHELLALDPTHFQLNQQLGSLEIQVGDYTNAVEHLSRAVLAKPQSWGALSNLGLAYMRQGELQKAQEYFDRALVAKPDNLQILLNLAQVHQQQGSVGESVKIWRRLLQLHGNNVKVLEQAGHFYCVIGDWNQAIDLFKKLLQVAPRNWSGFTGLGNCYRSIGQPLQAYRAFSKALEIDPRNPASHSNLGLMQWERGDAESAAKSFKNALALNENFLPALHNLADYYEKANQLEEAQACCEKALSINPNLAPTLRVRAAIQRRQKDLDAAERTLNKALGLMAEGETQADIFSELGKVLDKKGNFSGAFEAFKGANDIQAKLFDPSRQRRQNFQNLLQHYRSYQWPDKVIPAEALIRSTPTPVFVVGFPRSGTTLLNQMLDGHHQLNVLEEKPLIDQIATTIAPDSTQMIARINLLSTEQKIELRKSYFKSAAELTSADLNQITLADKFPLNLIHLPLIHTIFPEAKIVVCYRHSLDSVLSNFQQKYRLNEAMANFLTLEDAAIVYKEVMGLWLNYRDYLKDKAHVFRYENLINEPEAELRALVGFLELPWQAEMLDYVSRAQRKTQINTPSYQAVTENLYTSSMQRWKNYRAELEPIFEELKPLMVKLSYSIE